MIAAQTGLVWAVVLVALTLGGLCVIAAIVLAFGPDAKGTRQAAKTIGNPAAPTSAFPIPAKAGAAPKAAATPVNPSQPQGGYDFQALASLANSLAKLGEPDRFLFVGIGFVALAAAAATAGVGLS